MTEATLKTRKPQPAGSNAVLLTGREWLAAGLFTLGLFLCAPGWWARAERLEIQADYRMPYDLSNDYWLYDRYVRAAARRYDTLLAGDSVIWGQYVTPHQTLSHYLNELAGRERFGNLGLDGAHPAALAGLLEHYAANFSGKEVLLQFNPLWLSSDKSDLRCAEKISFNHPQLVPQFQPWIPCYKEEMSRRLGIVIARNVPFESWTSHLQLTYFDKLDIPAWTLEHPYESPLQSLTFKLPPADGALRHRPVSWTESGVQMQDFAWVDLATSLQWQSFQRALEILTQRGNRVVVLVGPFNEHLLTPASRARYARLKSGVEEWLCAHNVAYLAPPALPSEEYADASHPLSVGYRNLAEQLFQSRFAANAASGTTVTERR